MHWQNHYVVQHRQPHGTHGPRQTREATNAWPPRPGRHTTCHITPTIQRPHGPATQRLPRAPRRPRPWPNANRRAPRQTWPTPDHKRQTDAWAPRPRHRATHRAKSTNPGPMAQSPNDCHDSHSPRSARRWPNATGNPITSPTAGYGPRQSTEGNQTHVPHGQSSS